MPVYISFIVSIYNVEAYLEECVQSLCRIKEPGIEILLINDGATDRCPAICQKYAEYDERIRFVTQNNQGVSMSRNNGLMLARGKWVCFVDGDDCLSDDFDSRIIQQIDDTVEINYFGYQRMMNGTIPSCIDRKEYFLSGKDIKRAQLRILNRDIYKAVDKFPDTILFEAAFTKFINREKLLEWKISFDNSVAWGEDLLFNFRLLQYVKRVKVIDRTGYFYRINAESVTHRYDVQTSEKFRFLIEAMGDAVEKTGTEEHIKQYQVFVVKQLLQSVQRDMLNPQNVKSFCQRREDYRRVRELEVVCKALKRFPYKSVRTTYKVAVWITATGSYGLLWLFYQVKCLKEKKDNVRSIASKKRTAR